MSLISIYYKISIFYTCFCLIFVNYKSKHPKSFTISGEIVYILLQNTR